LIKTIKISNQCTVLKIDECENERKKERENASYNLINLIFSNTLYSFKNNECKNKKRKEEKENLV